MTAGSSKPTTRGVVRARVGELAGGQQFVAAREQTEGHLAGQAPVGDRAAGRPQGRRRPWRRTVQERAGTGSR